MASPDRSDQDGGAVRQDQRALDGSTTVDGAVDDLDDPDRGPEQGEDRPDAPDLWQPV